jgi:hypothetical protein
VTFSLSSEGIVTVQARDSKTGAERSTQVKLSSGLSEEEIDDIVRKGRTEDVARRGAAAGPLAGVGEASHPGGTERESIPLPEEDDDEMMLVPEGEARQAPAPDDDLFGTIEEDLDVIEAEAPAEPEVDHEPES